MHSSMKFGVVVMAGLVAVVARADVITFDTMWPWQIVLNGKGSLQTQGYAFTPTLGNANGHIVGGSYQPEGNPQGNQPLVSNGTPNLMCANWVNLNLAPVGGASFSLTSFEIGGTFNQEQTQRWSWASAVLIVGHLAGGGADLTYLFVMGSEFALQPVTLNWTGLSSVDFLPQQNEFGGENDYEFTVDSLAVQTGSTGDLNCDGLVNAFDIDPFILALSDQAGYQTALPYCSIATADCNGDGSVNAFDIDPFITLLTNG